MTAQADGYRRLGRAAVAGALLLVVAASLGGCLLFPRRQPVPGVSSGGTGRVDGVLTDDRGQGIPGVSVAIPEVEQVTAITGVDGRFTLTGLVPGQYNVVARKEGFLTGAFSVTVGAVGSTPLAEQLTGSEGRLHNDSTRVPNLCAQCHVLHDPTSASHLTLGGSPNDTCASCHKPGGTGVAVDQTIFRNSPHGPAWMPDTDTPVLTVWPGQVDSGRGYCSSCHEPHGITGPPKMLRAGQTSLNDLCLTCHAAASTVGHTAGWPGKAAYTASGNLHANPVGVPPGTLTVYPGTSYRAGECLNCHKPHGVSYPEAGGNYPRMTRDYGNTLCLNCHTGMKATATGTTGHRQCTLCHEPHNVSKVGGVLLVKNPANPTGPLMQVPKAPYRGQTMISDSYCLGCHKTPKAAGYPTAKDPYTETQFTNAQAKPDTSLHRVHVLKIQPDQTMWGDRNYEHDYPYRGNVNTVRCVQCHSVHPTSPAPYNLKTSLITNRTKTGNAYNGKPGCSVTGGCHTCNWCHASPGGPGVDCTCGHSDPGYHGVAY